VSDRVRSRPIAPPPSDRVARPPARKPSIRGRPVVLVAFVVVLLAVPFLRPYVRQYNYVLQLMFTSFMWAAMASSWNLMGGFAGYISLGHPVFFALGGYLSGTLLVYLGISPFLTAIPAGLAAVAAGLLIGLITLRTRGPSFIISTIALLLLVRIWFDRWELLGGSNGLSLPLLIVPGGLAKVPFYYAMLMVAVGSVYLSYRVQHSKFGLALRAISQDEVKAEVAGISTNMYKILAFALSGFFIAVAGALWGYSLSYLRPTVFLTVGVAANMVLMAILGGRGTVAGPVIGAVLFVAINEISVSQFGSTELNIVVTGLILVVVLLFFPQGIVGSLREHRILPRILDWD
jgi:branched-chain amino acid transport system permease protein